MTAAFIKKQRAILQGLLDRLSGVHVSRSISGALDDSSKSLEDVGAAVADIEATAVAAGNSASIRSEVSAAIKKIDSNSGSYGICEMTGETIGIERLEAIPWARFSIKAQEEVENSRRRGGSYGYQFDDEQQAQNEDDE